jgi:hypothetical protein
MLDHRHHRLDPLQSLSPCLALLYALQVKAFCPLFIVTPGCSTRTCSRSRCGCNSNVPLLDNCGSVTCSGHVFGNITGLVKVDYAAVTGLHYLKVPNASTRTGILERNVSGRFKMLSHQPRAAFTNTGIVRSNGLALWRESLPYCMPAGVCNYLSRNDIPRHVPLRPVPTCSAPAV